MTSELRELDGLGEHLGAAPEGRNRAERHEDRVVATVTQPLEDDGDA
jgi:hypothetical protein